MTRAMLAASVAAFALICVGVGWALGALWRARRPHEDALEAEIAALTARLRTAEAERDAARSRLASPERPAPAAD